MFENTPRIHNIYIWEKKIQILIRLICRNLQKKEPDRVNLTLPPSGSGGDVKKNNTTIILIKYRIVLKHEEFKYIAMSNVLWKDDN